jgi:HAD superfamily hydrolase (TIGR01509 family)
MTYDAIIFDFDGVLADSEVQASGALAESLSAIGMPTSFEEALRDYYGHNWRETQRRIEERLGRPLPDDFRETHRVRSRAWFDRGFDPVDGAVAFLERTEGMPRAIASSSSAAYINAALKQFGLAGHFGDKIFSADGLARGKPHPDIYLMAATGLGIAPHRCLAIEDSPVGARAAVAAGMHVIGLCAAKHIRDAAHHAETLRAVGVHQTVFAFDEIKLPDVVTYPMS